VGALADEFVQASDIDEGRVRPGDVEVAEKADRRVPGDRFAPDPVSGGEVAGGLIQCCGEPGRADGGYCLTEMAERIRHTPAIHCEIPPRGVRPLHVGSHTAWRIGFR
jgi:hypothetical protein